MNVRDVAIQLADGGPVRRSGGGWTVRCPAHDDTNPSLSIDAGQQQDVVLHCFAGCTTEEVLAAAGLTWADLGDADEQPVSESEHTYDYTDERGRLLNQVVRRPGKKFLQRHQDSNGEWVWNLRGVRRVLYRLPDVEKAVAAGEPVWITEGEKDAEYVRAVGVCATTNLGGAGKWTDEYSAVLEGADVTVWADRDEAGWKHARQVRESLLPLAAAVRIVESVVGKDAADHLTGGHTLDDVVVTVPSETFEPPMLFLRADEFIDQPRVIKDWAIPGLMRRGGERLIVTGYEGYGKSSLLKQMAVCAAVGLHPFLLEPMGEVGKRVVFIDCENPKEDVQEDFSRLREAAREEGRWDDPDLFIEAHPPMNLNDLPDAVWLAERARAHRPDLLVIGPLYNLMTGDSSKEQEVRQMLRHIGAIQEEVDCAVVMEHHVPHAMIGEERTVRPIGSTVLQRWASFGFGLMPVDKDSPFSGPFEFRPWRGVRRRGRSWPIYLRQSQTRDHGWYWLDAGPEQ